MPEPEVVNAVNQAATSLNHSLEGLKADVRKSHSILEKIVEFFSRLQRTVEDAVSRVLQNQSMMLLISKTSELESFRDLLGEQQAVLEQKKQYLIEDLTKLQDRYERLNNDLTHSTDSTVQKLDGHVINLSSEYYEPGPGRAYERYAAPLATSEERYFIDCSIYRGDVVEGSAARACEAIDRFLKVRDDFVNEAKTYVSPQDRLTEGSRPLPCMLVARQSSSDISVLAPGAVTYTGSGAELVPDAPARTAADRLQQRVAAITPKMTYRPLSADERAGWSDMVEQLFADGALTETPHVSLKQALLDLIATTDIEIGERTNG